MRQSLRGRRVDIQLAAVADNLDLDDGLREGNPHEALSRQETEWAGFALGRPFLHPLHRDLDRALGEKVSARRVNVERRAVQLRAGPSSTR